MRYSNLQQLFETPAHFELSSFAGIAAGWGDSKYIGLDLMNFMIVFLQCIFVVGLRALGVHMIDPYGDDLEDLSVISYIEGTLEVCGIILKSRQPEYTDQ